MSNSQRIIVISLGIERFLKRSFNDIINSENLKFNN